MVDAMILAAQQPLDAPAYSPAFASLADLVRMRAEAERDRLFLITYDAEGRREAYSFAAFAGRVRRVAGLLTDHGIKSGDRVATILHNHQEAIFLMYATWWLGATLVPLNIEESPARKRFILQNAEARILFSLPEYLPEIEPYRSELPLLREVLPVGDKLEPGEKTAPPVTDITAEALIVYTSGTTGNPKGVVLNQYNMLADADAIVRWFNITPGERWMTVLPVHHINGIIVTVLSPLYVGAVVVLNRRFSTRTFWQRAEAEGVSVSSLVPTLLEFLLEGGTQFGRPPATMRGVICGAGPLAIDTVMRFEQFFNLPVWHGYGLSETSAYASMTPLDLSTEARRRWYSEHGFPTIGAAMPHQSLAILDETGGELAAGERGEICIKGSTIMQGYYQRPDANAETFKYPGWFRSGDEGFWLPAEDGRRFFFITGRIKELIIRGGVNLSPLEIDAALTQHPAVRFGMAVAFDNRIYGEEVAAYVVPRDGHEPSDSLAGEIKAFCAARLSFPMQPKVVLFGSEVPYTSTGKPKRLALKTMLADRLREYREVQFREGERHGR